MLSDFKLAFRLLAKSPLFSAIAVVTLAVGIGSATVVFSALNALLLKPLPLVPQGERLVSFTQHAASQGLPSMGVSYPDFLALKARMNTLEGLWVHSERTVIIAGQSAPERLVGTDISADAFSAMGVKPLLGRIFSAIDSLPIAPQVAILSEPLWRRRFGGDPGVIDRVVQLNDQPYKIIGVMPPGWAYPDLTDIWSPIRPDEKMAHRGAFYLTGRGKVRPGVRLEEVNAEAASIMTDLAREHPATNVGIGVRFTKLSPAALHDTADLLRLLFAAGLFVFLISCLNVANLLLARTAARSKEFAVRLALGAERGAIVRQQMSESLVLAALGGIGGFIFALWGVDLMTNCIPVEIPFWLRFEFDSRVFGFVLALSVCSSLLFGLAPALRAARPSVADELKEGGRSSFSGASRHPLRSVLVVAEVAIALVLLVGAGLMMRSFAMLRNSPLGLDPHNILTFRTGFPPAMLGGEKTKAFAFFERVAAELRSIPGVTDVGMVSVLPGLDRDKSPVQMEGTPDFTSLSLAPIAADRVATPSYFSTLKIPLLAGQLFPKFDGAAAKSRFAVVDATFARLHFQTPQNAVGKRFRPVGKLTEPGDWLEISGVVGDVPLRLDATASPGMFYRAQEVDKANFLSVVVRTTGSAGNLVEPARLAVAAADPKIPIYHVLTLDDVLSRTIWPRRFFSYLFAVFGGVALFLACIGIYGVMGYTVAQRTQEIGVRMALGAKPSEVIGMMLGHGALLVGAGLASGLIIALLSTRLLRDSLHGVSPYDALTFTLIPLFLAVVALVACYLPSRRATQISPTVALRAD